MEKNNKYILNQELKQRYLKLYQLINQFYSVDSEREVETQYLQQLISEKIHNRNNYILY